MQTKRILVIEESEVIRETLALILGREFLVAKRPFGKGMFSIADTDRDVDLVILGVTPAIGKEPSSLLRFADKAPFAVLFLVDSKSAARAIEDREQVDCLAKPFSPYELKEKVGRLLARRTILSKTLSHSPVEPQERLLGTLSSRISLEPQSVWLIDLRPPSSRFWSPGKLVAARNGWFVGFISWQPASVAGFY